MLTTKVLAYGLMQMKGVGGLAGWRWIFIIEGLLTAVVGVGGGCLLVDFPDKVRPSSHFLSQRQLDWVIQRLQHDHGIAEPEKFSWTKFFAAGRNPPVWLYGIIAW